MRVLHVTASLAEEWGGPTRVVTALTQALARKGTPCTVVAPIHPRNGRVVRPEGVEVRLFPTDWLGRWWTAHSSQLARALRGSMDEFDLVHIHELWHHPHYVAAREAARHGKPYMVSIHGAMKPWALRHKRRKKRLYTRLIQRHILKGAAAFHAETEAEAQQVRQQGLGRPVVVIPNGIDPAEFQTLPPREAFEGRYPELVGKRVVLFLGRLHPIKALDALSRAFGEVARTRDDLRLVIAGPDSNGYVHQVRRWLHEAGAIDQTLFTGMLSREECLAALARADLFVLPSYSEGFSMAVLEALAAGCPVIISRACGFPQVAQSGAGMVVDPDANQLAQVLAQLLDQPELRRRMGMQGHALVLERYTWDRIADEFLGLYQRVLGRPDAYSGTQSAPG